MPSRTNEDKIEELTKLCATFTTQIEALQGALKGMVSDDADVQKAVSDLKTASAVIIQQIAEIRAWKDSLGSFAQIETRVALLEQSATDLKTWKDETKRREEEFGKKLWMIVPPVLAAILSSSLTAAFTYLLKH
jgi:chromosome segregation ATPase